MKHRVSIDSDVLVALRNYSNCLSEAMDKAERSAAEGQTSLLTGDITCKVTEDEEYVILEDVANGIPMCNVMEIPADWFEELAIEFLKKRGKYPKDAKSDV